MNENGFLYQNSSDSQLFYEQCKNLLEHKDSELLKGLKWFSIMPTFLFYGLPGTGKTTLAYSTYYKLKEKMNIELHILKIESCLSSNFGESSNNLINFFQDVKNSMDENKSYAFIIIDELDSLALHRFVPQNASIQRVLNTFNKELDELSFNGYLSKMIIIATTNLKDLIDSSTQRRFYFHYSFDMILSEENFKEFFKKALNPFPDLSKLILNDNMTKLYKIYTEKQFTLGELKRIIANVWMNKYMASNSNFCLSNFEECFSKEKSYYQTLTAQKGMICK